MQISSGSVIVSVKFNDSVNQTHKCVKPNGSVGLEHIEY